MNVNKSLTFATDGLFDISVTILANNHSAGIVEVYEEDKQIRSESVKGQEGKDSKARV